MPRQIITINPRGATKRSSFGKLRGQGLDAGPRGHSRLSLQEANLEGTAEPAQTALPPQPLPSSSTFPVKTNSWGRGRRRSGRVPGKPRQQTPNRRPGPRLALAAARFAYSRRAGGRGREGVPSRSPDGGKPLAERSLARPQRDVNSGPATATRPPPGPEARDHPDTRRGYSAPAPRSHAGRRFDVKQEDWGERALSPLAPRPAPQH